MLKKICFLFILFLSLKSNSQNRLMDSLKKELSSTIHDTTRCKTMYLLFSMELEHYMFTNTCNQLIDLCNKKLLTETKGKPLNNFYTKLLGQATSGLGINTLFTGGTPEKAIKQTEKGLKISESIADKEGIGAAYMNLGTIYQNLGESDKAIENFEKSLKIFESLTDKKSAATILYNIGDVYKFTDAKKAEEYYQRSLDYRTEINNTEGIAFCYVGFGEICRNNGEILKAIDYYNKALKILEASNNTGSMAEVYNNLGGTYMLQGDNDKGLEYFKKALKYFEANADTFSVATGLNNIGTIYFNKKNYLLAEQYYTKSLRIREKINDKKGIAYSYSALCSINTVAEKYAIADEYCHRSLQMAIEVGDEALEATANTKLVQFYLPQGKINEAYKYGMQGLALSKKLQFPAYIREAAKYMAAVYVKKNDPAKALETYSLYIQMKDSVTNKSTRTASLRSQLNYEYEKKEAVLVEQQEKERIIAEEKARQQKIIIWSIIGGLSLTLIFAIIIFNRLKLTRQQKQIIEHQKHEVEEKHKEITDSINYAERIQRSFLATKEILNENLKDHFVFFQPKDVVSGDFYWACKLSNNNFALVTADSTGHGVPGAIMSILNISCLENAVKAGVTQASEILDHTRINIIERLKKDGSAEGGKDGMDASLICFDFNNNQLSYAAANNPVWVIRNNEIIELPCDKMPVGKHDKDKTPFTQHNFDLIKEDMVYTLTDGMPDQFGGPKGKKFMYKKLKELLIKISNEPMAKQKQILTEALQNWKGNLEQVDDVCVIGVRV
jgi:tetratricopeptide (TPR) repeat protein